MGGLSRGFCPAETAHASLAGPKGERMDRKKHRAYSLRIFDKILAQRHSNFCREAKIWFLPVHPFPLRPGTVRVSRFGRTKAPAQPSHPRRPESPAPPFLSYTGSSLNIINNLSYSIFPLLNPVGRPSPVSTYQCSWEGGLGDQRQTVRAGLWRAGNPRAPVSGQVFVHHEKT